MSQATMQIGEIAQASGVTAKMIRHYEDRGLIPEPIRGANGYRYYRENDVHRLRFVHRARELGFSLEQIGQLLGLWDNQERSSREVHALAREHLADIEDRIRRLESMRGTLKHLVNHCHGDDRPDCPILEALEAPDSTAGNKQ